MAEYSVDSLKLGRGIFRKMPEGDKRLFGDDGLSAYRVFEFGCLAPTTNENIMVEQMQKRSELWNKLVGIECAYREKVKSLLMVDDDGFGQRLLDLASLKQKIRQYDKSEKEPIDIAGLQRQAELLQTEITMKKQEMAKKRKELLAQHRPDLQALDKERIEQTRAAQAASGLFWCNYDDVLAIYRSARRKAMRDGRELKGRGFDGSGKVSVRYQYGLPVGRVFGGDTKLQIDCVPEAAWSSPVRAERRKLSRTNVRIRIGSQGRKPVWLELPLVMHRSLPPDGIIRGASVVRKKLGNKYCYKLLVTVANNHVSRKRPETDGSIGVDFGWRRVEDGLRVIYWCDSFGNHGQLILPDKVISQFAKVNDLRSIRRKNFNDARNYLAAWLRRNQAPPWLTEITGNLLQWRSPRELIRVTRAWHQRRFKGDGEITAYLAMWMKQELHLWSWEINLRDQLQRHRREIYRNFAAAIARKYAGVYMENIELDKMVRRTKLEGGMGGWRPADYQRTVASVSALKRIIESACEREGAISRYIEAAGSTMECCSCGYKESFDSAKQIMHTCPNCGIVCDQDYNAAQVILQRGLQNQDTYSPKRRGSRMAEHPNLWR